MMNLRERIPTIMEQIDFERIHRVMTVLNWKWVSASEPIGFSVPSTLDIALAAERILVDCITMWENEGRSRNGYYASSGGFEARIDCYDDGEATLALSFQIESADA